MSKLTTFGYSAIKDLANRVNLDLLGVADPHAGDPVPEGCRAIALFGPHEPGFWDAFTASPEGRDGGTDPIDRWSTRVVGQLADTLGGTARFPFGAPHAPFISWALRTERIWASPISMLVHETAGLFVSFRGAIALPWKVASPPAPENPCTGCRAPCQRSCPVNALGAATYNLEACHGYLDSTEGRECMQAGCAARRACPVSQSFGRLPAQSAFHMKAFHK